MFGKSISAVLRKAVSGVAVPQLSIGNQKFTVVADGEKKPVSNFDKENGVTYCRVIFVNAAAHVAKLYYEGDYDPDDVGVPPTCSSEDGIFPSANIGTKQAETCAQCPMNAWGSATSKMTGKSIKACKDIYKTAVIVPEYSMDTPLMFRVPPASLKNFLEYAESVEKADRDLSQQACIIYFMPDKTGILGFAPQDFEGTDEAGLAALYHDKTDHLIGADRVQVHEVTEIEAPKKQRVIEHKPFKVAVQEADDPEEKPKGVPNMKGMRTGGAPKKTAAKPAFGKSNGGTPEGIPETKGPSGIKGMLASVMGMNTDD